jgi:hypothetical protein
MNIGASKRVELQRRLQTEEDLLADLGPLSDEESALLANKEMFAPITAKERQRLGPSFAKRVSELAWNRRYNTDLRWLPGRTTASELLPVGLHLLGILREIQAEETDDALKRLRTESAHVAPTLPALRQKEIQLAQGLVDLWCAEVEEDVFKGDPPKGKETQTRAKARS